MRSLAQIVAVGFVAIAIGAPARAQRIVLPDSGARVRALASGSRSWTVGTLIGTSGDTLLIQTRPYRCCGVDTLTLRSITALDVSRDHGASTEKVFVGAALGAAAGAAVGLGVTVIGCAIDDAGGMCALAALPSMFVLGTVGLLVGVYVASKVHSDGWDRIYPPRRAAIIVAPTGNHTIGLGVAFAFGGSA